MNNLNQTEILLESGTNEFEIMEFTIDGQIFGINVAKVLEIMKYREIKPMQNAHPVVEGIFKPRDAVITVIDLAKYLGLAPSADTSHDIFIITNFNSHNFAFHVHSVVGINRISWRGATGIAEYEDRLITILDFEKIVSEISPEIGLKVKDIDALEGRMRSEKRILIAEDSMLLSKLITECLHRAGYVNTVKVDNGQEAWDYLCEAKESGDPLEDHVDLVVTDIEMPQMDGHRLTKLIKEDATLKKLPVILFSSLINEAMRVKGEQLGADAQISKPEIAGLVSLIDQLLEKKEQEQSA